MDLNSDSVVHCLSHGGLLRVFLKFTYRILKLTTFQIHRTLHITLIDPEYSLPSLLPKILLWSLKRYYDQKITSFFPLDFKTVFVSHLNGKILRFEFYPKAVFFSASLEFHGLPLFMVKTDQLDFRGLDQG